MAQTILIVDDEPDIRELIGEILADEGFSPLLAGNAAEARKKFDDARPDLVLLDVWMPDCDGISLLKEWQHGDRLDCPVVMISGHGSVETAVEATRHGAVDFIEKPVSMARLLSTIRKALSESRQIGAGDDSQVPDALDPIGRSDATERLRGELDSIAATRSHVLMVGEPGSGRTSLARWIHARSGLPDDALIRVICGAGDTRLEQLGRRAESGEAAVGTLLLERFESAREIDCANLERLLDGLDRNPSRPLRVIGAALPSIDPAVAAGRFDRAVLNRVGELRLEIPSLRERRDDIPDLVRHFSEQLPLREKLTYRPFPVAVQNRLRQYEWPGNLRELANLIRQLLATGAGSTVEIEELEPLLEKSAGDQASKFEDLHSPLFELPLREAREAFERQYLLTRLRRVDGSVGQLAEAVEMERTHLYRKLRQLGIDPKQVHEDSE